MIDHALLAAELHTASRGRTPIEPLTARFPDLTVADAYAVQRAQMGTRVSTGARVTGHKIGLTSRAMQRQLGVSEPDFGHLLTDMEMTSNQVRLRDHIAPKAEPEMAVVLGSDLWGPGLTVRDVAAAVSHVTAAIEVIDSRIRDWRIGLVDTIADNASSGSYLLSNRLIPLAGLDLARIGCVVRVSGEIAATGTGAAVLGNPLAAVAWLANALGERGRSLHAGHVVLSGSLTTAVDLLPGTTVSVDFAGLGPLSLHVEDEDRS